MVFEEFETVFQVHATGFLQHRVGEEAFLNQLIGLKVVVDIEKRSDSL